MTINKIILIFIFCLIFQSAVRADVIELKSGLMIDGTIVEKTQEIIKLDTGVGVAVTYYIDEIETINGAPTDKVWNSLKVKGEAELSNKPQSNVLSLEESLEHIKKNREDEIARALEQEQSKLAHTDDAAAQKAGSETILQGPIKKDIAQRLTDLKLEEIEKRFRQSNNKFSAGFLIALFIIGVFLYALYCFPIYLIAHTMRIDQRWFAWIPILQVYLLVKMARKSLEWFFIAILPIFSLMLGFVPFLGALLQMCAPLVSYVTVIILWMNIAKRLRRPAYLGLLTAVPLLNLGVIWYLALAKD